MSIIVVEGVDASGKSTLLENIRSIPKKYFLLIRHSCRPLVPRDILDFLVFIEEERRENPLWKVVDRHPLVSEPIYGPLLRNEDLSLKLFTKDQSLRRLERTVERIIYCRPPLELIQKNLGNRPQLAGIDSNIGKLLDLYDARMDELRKHVDVVPYDYTKPIDFKKLVFGEG